MDCSHTPFASVAHAIVRRLQAAPGGCAIRYRDTGISNAALLHAVLRLAEGLRAAGIGPGTRAGICFERSPATPAVMLALWWRGAVYVPLDPSLPRERLFTMCEIAELDILLTQASLLPRVESLPCPVLPCDMPTFTADPSPASDDLPEAHVTADSLAYILFTSGSSGAPKGVKIAHGNLVVFFAAAQRLLQLPDSCRILGCTNFSFDIAFFELLAPLLCGGTLVLADDSECTAPLRLLQLIQRERVTLVQATPSHWQLLVALDWAVPVEIALVIGEALLRDTALAISRCARTLWNLYGPTECTIWASAHRVTARDFADNAPALISIGRELSGYTLRLEGITTAVGAQAEELVIEGDGVGLGYCTSSRESGFMLAQGSRSYRTGDLCRRDPEGLLHFCGRRDQQAKHNGYRIEPEEIALLLRQHMSIHQAACVVRPATHAVPSLLFACIVPRPGMPNRGKAELNRYLATYLPEWMLPQRYFFLEQLPLNGNGKLDRAALHALAAPALPQPRTPDELEANVSAIFCEVLDIPGIGPCDSFLDLGGTSMLVATLVMTLNERLGTTLTLRQALATPPTVAGIVQLLRVATKPAS
jgi:amino acid adenylation domain-containing protein